MSKYKTSNKKLSAAVAHTPQHLPARANPIHSVLTSLPVIMLLAALGYYYFSENKQQTGSLILTKSVSYDGRYEGTSAQSSSPGAQRIVWVRSAAGLRGFRISADQLPALQSLAEETPISVTAAPRVADSKVLWVYQLVTDQGDVLLSSAGDSGEKPVLIGDENTHKQ